MDLDTYFNQIIFHEKKIPLSVFITIAANFIENKAVKCESGSHSKNSYLSSKHELNHKNIIEYYSIDKNYYLSFK